MAAWPRDPNDQGPPSQPNIDEWIRRFLENRKRWTSIGVLAAIVLWLVSGIYTVGPGEVGVVRQFGQLTAQTDPGLRYRIPFPVQSVSVVDVATVRRAEVGFRPDAARGTRSVPDEALMLTGDENIVEVHLFIQYVVSDAAAFLFQARDPDDVLRTAAEVALRGMVGQHPIDFTMTEGRVVVQDAVHEYLQDLLDRYRTGLLVTEARLLVVDPPDQVIDAFHEVVRALEDRERLVQEAEGYREDIVPRARGEAAQILASADAYKERRVLEARGDVAAFVSVFEEYDKARVVTRDRLYLEMVERTLPQVRLVVVDEGMGGQLLPLFSLDRLMEGGGR